MAELPVVMETKMAEKFNARLKLANSLGPKKQWWVIESVLKRAEELGPSPRLKQVNDGERFVLIFFAMTPPQVKDFLASYPPPSRTTGTT